MRLTVPNLPTLSSSHNYKCLFGVTETSATVDGNEVVCQPPMAAAITQQPHSPASGMSGRRCFVISRGAK